MVINTTPMAKPTPSSFSHVLPANPMERALPRSRYFHAPRKNRDSSRFCITIPAINQLFSKTSAYSIRRTPSPSSTPEACKIGNSRFTRATETKIMAMGPKIS